MAKNFESLREKIISKNAQTGVIGLGYVGLPLAVLFAKRGYNVLGFDIKAERVVQVNKGISYIKDVSDADLSTVVKAEKLKATGDFELLSQCDVIAICVPTPVDKNKTPIITYVLDTTNEIKPRLRDGQLIILKSTTFPETTEKVILPILCETGKQVGKDFFLAFSPERIDPGNKKYTVENTPIVVGGVTKNCTMLAKLFYETLGLKVTPVSSPRVAEMTKLLENTFRNVNIALVNELAQLCERMGIDVWEVIDAASTKPFGYMPFYPGPGVGGHCIPIDPYYLFWKAQEYDFHTSFIELSARINENMPYYVKEKIIEALSESGKCPAQCSILILGITFKRDVEDLRDSPALKLIEILEGSVRNIDYHDPYVKKFGEKASVELTSSMLKKYDCVVITTDHSCVDYRFVVEHANLIIDTRNATKGIVSEKIYKLGAPRIKT